MPYLVAKTRVFKKGYNPMLESTYEHVHRRVLGLWVPKVHTRKTPGDRNAWMPPHASVNGWLVTPHALDDEPHEGIPRRMNTVIDEYKPEQ